MIQPEPLGLKCILWLNISQTGWLDQPVCKCNASVLLKWESCVLSNHPSMQSQNGSTDALHLRTGRYWEPQELTRQTFYPFHLDYQSWLPFWRPRHNSLWYYSFWVRSVTRMNFFFCSHGNFQPGLYHEDEMWWGIPSKAT